MARSIPMLVLLLTLLLSTPAVAATYAEVWSVDGDLFTVGDADNDGKDEIIVLPCDIYSCSAAGCKRDYSCGATASDVWSLAVGDGDNDGNNEIYLGKTGGFSVYRCDNSRCVEAGQGETLYSGRAVGFAAGDVNNDGFINIVDIVLVVDIILNNDSGYSDNELWASDVNADNETNISDIIIVLDPLG